MKIVNRDLSIAVLRAFAAKRQEEHEESLLKKASRKKVPTSGNGKENGEAQEQGAASTAEAEDAKPEASPSEAMAEDQDSEIKEEKSESSPSGKAEEVAAAAAPVEPAVESRTAKPLHVLEVLLLQSLCYWKSIIPLFSNFPLRFLLPYSAFF